MDPYGGNNPSSPRLDSAPVSPQQQPASTASIGTPVTPAVSQPAPTAPTIPTPVADQASPMASPLGSPPSNIGGVSDLGISSESKGPIGGKGKTVALIAIGGVLVVGIAVGAYFVGNKTGVSQGQKVADAAYQKKEAERQRQEAENNEPKDTAELDLGSDLVEPEYKDENVEGDIGKQLTSSDGLVLKVTNIERNFKTDDPNYKLDATKELVKVNFLMGNIAKDKAKDVTNFAFYLQNSTEARLTPESIVSYTDKFDTVKLDPGSQSKGSIVYLVNKDEKPLKFIREQRYRFSGENREVTTRTIINVADK